MQFLKESCDTRLSAIVRSVSKFGVLCALAAMVPLMGGCPPQGVTTPQGDVGGACLDDGTCTDNGVFCDGDEVCNADNICESAGDPCNADQACNEDTDACDCTADAGCDDGNECTDDVCNAGACENTNNTAACDDNDSCTDGDACAGGACAGTPADCDDADACTTDSCDAATGDCVNTPMDCDDADACTDDACVDGVCSNVQVECLPSEACVDGVCEVITCVDDADCDNNDLCDGTETCVAAACVSGTALNCDDGDPCTTDTCDSVAGCSNTAVTCPAGETCDGTTGNCVASVDETFAIVADASATQAEGDSGTTNFTFTVTRTNGTAAKTVDYAVTGGTGTGDAAADDFDGGAFPSGTVDYVVDENGDKTITIAVSGDANVESDEVFTVTLTDPDNSGAELGTATGTIQNDDSSAAPAFTLPVGAGATVGQNSAIGGISVADSDNGTSTVDITTTDGFLSFSAAPAATAVDGNGNAVTTANVLKTAYTLTGSIANINQTLAGFQFTTDRSSGNPGTDQVLFTGTDADGGVGMATLDVNVGIQISLTSLSDTGTTFTGTPGGDVFLATTPSFWGQGDILAGGDGPDTIELRAAAAATYPSADVAAFSCTGIETLWVSSTAGAPTLDNLGDVSGLDTITYWPSGAHALTVDDAPDGCIVNVATNNGAFGAAVDIDIKSATFGVQGFTVNMLGDSTNGCIITTLNNGNADVENLTLHSASRNGTTTTANALSTGAGGNIALTSLTITGDSNLNLGTWANGDAKSISAAAFTGKLTVTSYAESGGSLAGGTGDDTLVCGAGAQSVDGGAGNDTLTGGAGADQYTCGAGSDTLLQTSNDSTDTVKDFDFGTSSTAVDTITFSLAAIEAYGTIVDLTSASLVSTSATDAMTYTALTADAATPGDVDIIGIIGDYANAAAALAAKTSWTITYGSTATADDAILIAYKSGTSVRIAVIVNTATATSDGIDSITDLLILENTSLSNLDSLDFNALGT